MIETQKVGEVIEATTADLVAQAYELHRPPPFGSLVRVGLSDVIYGAVYNATTTSIEPGRRPIARGRDEASEDDVYRNNPQLTKLLRTEFNVLVLGHRKGDVIYHYLPAYPARIHGFVYSCDNDEVRGFSHTLDFLNIMLGARVSWPVDELIAACIRKMGEAYQDSRPFLVAAGRELAVLLGGEPIRLNAVLKRIKG